MHTIEFYTSMCKCLLAYGLIHSSLPYKQRTNLYTNKSSIKATSNSKSRAIEIAAKCRMFTTCTRSLSLLVYGPIHSSLPYKQRTNLYTNKRSSIKATSNSKSRAIVIAAKCRMSTTCTRSLSLLVYGPIHSSLPYKQRTNLYTNKRSKEAKKLKDCKPKNHKSKITNRKISNRKIVNRKIANLKIKNQKIANRKIKNRKMMEL